MLPHPLLKRQLKRLGVEVEGAPPDADPWRADWFST